MPVSRSSTRWRQRHHRCLLASILSSTPAAPRQHRPCKRVHRLRAAPQLQPGLTLQLLVSPAQPQAAWVPQCSQAATCKVPSTWLGC